MKMLHVTIQTNKFDEEINFFIEHVGLKIVRDLSSVDKNIVFLANAAGETNIEIIENPKAFNSGNENISIGFKVGDLNDKRNELIKSSFEVTPIISPMPKVKMIFVKDPAGVNIQFME